MANSSWLMGDAVYTVMEDLGCAAGNHQITKSSHHQVNFIVHGDAVSKVAYDGRKAIIKSVEQETKRRRLQQIKFGNSNDCKVRAALEKWR
jgi:hypothetical protein